MTSMAPSKFCIDKSNSSFRNCTTARLVRAFAYSEDAGPYNSMASPTTRLATVSASSRTLSPMSCLNNSNSAIRRSPASASGTMYSSLCSTMSSIPSSATGTTWPLWMKSPGCSSSVSSLSGSVPTCCAPTAAEITKSSASERNFECSIIAMARVSDFDGPE